MLESLDHEVNVERTGNHVLTLLPNRTGNDLHRQGDVVAFMLLGSRNPRYAQCQIDVRKYIEPNGTHVYMLEVDEGNGNNSYYLLSSKFSSQITEYFESVFKEVFEYDGWHVGTPDPHIENTIQALDVEYEKIEGVLHPAEL